LDTFEESIMQNIISSILYYHHEDEISFK